jgi:hypothetical protein
MQEREQEYGSLFWMEQARSAPSTLERSEPITFEVTYESAGLGQCGQGSCNGGITHARDCAQMRDGQCSVGAHECGSDAFMDGTRLRRGRWGPTAALPARTRHCIERVTARGLAATAPRDVRRSASARLLACSPARLPARRRYKLESPPRVKLGGAAATLVRRVPRPADFFA